MKEQQPPLPHHQRRATAKKLTAPACLILLLLSYALGYLSALNSSSSSSSSFKFERSSKHAIARTIPNLTTTIIVSPLQSEFDHFRASTTRCGAPIPSKLVRQTIVDRVFNGTSPYDGFPPAHIRPLLRPRRIRGWGSNGAVFENLIRKVKPRTIIEVGTFLGASAIHMAKLASQLGLRTQILCIDDFRGWPGFQGRFRDMKMINGDVLLLQQFMQNLVYVNATETVLPVPFSSGSALEKLCEWGVFGDLIEVDAGHDFQSAWADITRAYKILRPGGVLFGHDYLTSADNRGVRRAVDLFARVKGLRVKLDGQHWVIDPA